MASGANGAPGGDSGEVEKPGRAAGAGTDNGEPKQKGGSRARQERSAGGVVVRRDDGDSRPLFLLIRDSYENWGFPKGHVERGERPEAAALREVQEETGLDTLAVRAPISTIDWYFRFRGRLIHKVCDFYLMELPRGASSVTAPQAAEGITACAWLPYDEASRLVSYANARSVLARANEIVSDAPSGA